MLYYSGCPYKADPVPNVGPWCRGTNQQCYAPPSKNSFCTDDQTFEANGDTKKKCQWIAKKPTRRCLLDRGAELGCPATCNPRCIGCADDPDYTRYNGKRCKWVVAKKANKRCKDEEVFNACSVTCNPICKTRCSNNPDYRNEGKKKRTCEWVRKNAEERCTRNDNEAFFGCPKTCNSKCECVDDLSYRYKNKEKYDCACWAGENPGKRCPKGDNAVFNACPKTCDPSCSS